jgi:hypothetical protein
MQAPHLTQVCLGSDYEVTRVGLGHLGACTALTHLTLGNFNISPPTPGVTPPPPPHMGSQSPSGFPALTYLEVRAGVTSCGWCLCACFNCGHHS